MNFLLNPWIGIGLAVLLVSSHGAAYYKGHQNASGKAAKEMTAYVAKIDAAKAARAAENAKVEQAAAVMMEQQKLSHQHEIDTLRRTYNAQLRDKSNALASAVEFRDRLRKQLEEANAAARLPRREGGFDGLAEGRGNGNAADFGQTTERYINTLEHACAVTTSDYNTLYTRCAAVNELYQVRK
jgi:hypothetical protein